MNLNRREFMQMMGVGAAAGMFAGCSQNPARFSRAKAGQALGRLYNLPMQGKVRILHITDTHAQLKPVYFREPNVNLGMGPAFGKLPHLVGSNLLNEVNVPANSPESYAFTYLNFDEAANTYGKVGGFSHIKTLLGQLREAAGGQQNTVTLDGGDLWHGSATSLWTRGRDMVEASNLLGVDAMVGHWEFTYAEAEVLSNIAAFSGDFIGQNVRIKEDALLEDTYTEMTDKYGYGMFDEDSGHAFKPYTVKQVNGLKVVIIGQAFPRTANANPPANFPDWSFGLREEDLQDLVHTIREDEKPALVLMLSHNGMDVDLKMASRVTGIDAILGGHTHDGIPKPVKVKNAGGDTLVTNAGSNGKFVGVMDFDLSDAGVRSVSYTLVPVFSEFLSKDAEMETFLTDLGNRVYDENIVESRREDAYVSKQRLGKKYKDILSEKLAVAGETLYRRGNFMGTWDQVIVNALREEHDTQIALSAGVRWGTSIPTGSEISMENVFDQTSMTYGETYRSELKGSQIKGILEGISENLFVKDPYLQSGGDMVRVGGMDYTIDPTAAFGQRISELRLDNGSPIESDKSYTVAGWAQVDQVGSGRLIWDVVSDYLRDKGTLELAKVNHPTVKSVKQNPGIADYHGKLI